MPTKSAFCVFLPLVWVTIILVHRAVCTDVVAWSSVFCNGLLPLSTRKHEKTVQEILLLWDAKIGTTRGKEGPWTRDYKLCSVCLWRGWIIGDI